MVGKAPMDPPQHRKTPETGKAGRHMSARECGCGRSGCGSSEDPREDGGGTDTTSGESGGPLGGDGMDRREFVHTAAVGGAALAASLTGLPIVAGPFHRQEGVDHFVPVDKRLTRQWTQTLFARGESTWYSGEDLQTIGMPVGGICAGQMYLTGDGRLVCWDIFNQNQSTGAGAVNYVPGRAPEQTVQGGRVVPAPAVGHGFAIRIRRSGSTVQRTLDREGVPPGQGAVRGRIGPRGGGAPGLFAFHPPER